MISNDKHLIILAGGFQPAYVKDVSNAFAELDYRVTLIGGDIHENKNYHRNVRFVNLRGNDSPARSKREKMKGLVQYYSRLMSFAAKSKIRFIYNVGTGRIMEQLALYTFFRIIGKKLIHTVHNLVPHGNATNFNRISYSIIYNLIANYLVVHTSAMVDELMQVYDVHSYKIILSHHGVYDVNIDPNITQQTARERLGLPGDKFIILSFGQQFYYKGTHLVLDALNKLDDNSILSVIRGSGNSEYANQLRQTISENNLADNVDFKFDYVKDEDIEYLFKAADVVVLSHIEGSQSGVLLMSYAFGKPVLASNTASFTDYVKPKFSGELFQLGNSESLKKSLMQMKNNFSSYKSEQIRSFALDEYSWNKFAHVISNKISEGNQQSSFAKAA